MRCLYSILLTLVAALSTQAQNTDIRILRSLYSSQTLRGDACFQFLTDSYPVVVAGTPLLMGATAMLTKDQELMSEALEIGASTLITTGLVLTVKYAVNRDRPFITYSDIVPKDVESGPSFPSFHTAASFNTATSLSLNHPRWYVIAPSFLWAGAVGYSRLRLGVHYPSDVLMGALMGAGSAWLTHELQKWYQKKQPTHYESFK